MGLSGWFFDYPVVLMLAIFPFFAIPLGADSLEIPSGTAVEHRRVVDRSGVDGSAFNACLCVSDGERGSTAAEW